MIILNTRYTRQIFTNRCKLNDLLNNDLFKDNLKFAIYFYLLLMIFKLLSIQYTYLIFIGTIYLMVYYKNPLLIIVSYILMKVFFYLLIPKSAKKITEAINKERDIYKEQAEEKLSQIGETAEKIQDRDGESALNTMLEQVHSSYGSMEGLKRLLNPSGIEFIMTTSISTSMKKTMLPSGVGSSVDFQNRYLNYDRIDEYLWFLENNYRVKNGEYTSFFRNLLIFKELNLFVFDLMSSAMESIQQNKLLQVKQIFIDNLLGDILNTYQLTNSSVNLVRYYSNIASLKEIKKISSIIHFQYKNGSKLSHVLVTGSKENILFVLYSFKQLIPFFVINNIDFHDLVQTVFKHFASEAQRNNLYAKLVQKPSVLVQNKHFISKFVLIFVKFLEVIVSQNNNEIVGNVINISNLTRNLNDLEGYLSTIKYIDMLPNKDKHDFIVAFCEGVVDSAVLDRFELSLNIGYLSLDEFYYFFRHQVLEYCSLYGNILPKCDTEIGHAIYLLSNRIYNKVRSLSIDEQKTICKNFFEFLKNNHERFTFKELLSFLS